MPDLGQKLTDERVDEINKRLLAAYTEAAKDLQKKAEAHTKKYQETEKRLQAEVNAGKKTQEYLDRWKAGQVFIGKQWQSKVDQMARSLVDTEKQAVEIVNGGQLDCFADNANYFDYRIDKDHGFSGNFSLYDETTVKGLIEQEPELMRRRYVDGQACEAWNRKIISNCVTQGILQGEKIGDIAKRIARDTASTDMKAMVRYARTAMTCAQNAGRLEAMSNSAKRGIYCKKVWLAVGDDRTREAHEELDGQTAEIDQPFDSILGEIMYPGDPGASDENVWNCRCALGYEYPDPPAGWQEEELPQKEEQEEFDEWVEKKKAEPEKKERKPKQFDIDKATDPEKIKKQMIKEGMIKSGGFGKADIETIKDFYKAYRAFLEKFPFLKGELGGLYVVKEGMNGITDRTYGNCNMRFGNISLNQSYFSNISKLKTQYEKDVSSGWHPLGTDYKAILPHEIGHALDGVLTRMFTHGEETTYSHALFEIVMNKEGMYDWQPFKDKEVEYFVSRYATKNEKEWFAESVAVMMTAKEEDKSSMQKIFEEQLNDFLRSVE